MPALVQSWRYSDIENTPSPPQAPLTAAFEGNVLGTDRPRNQRSLRIDGELTLEPGNGQIATGTVTGISKKSGESVSFALNGRVALGRPVFGSPRQEVRCDLAPDESGMQGQLVGTIKRPFLNWFQAPRDNEELDRMHSRLSQKFDIACVFTWVAGLLNIMAIWDAFDGPAYGYGDEDDESSASKND